jgi:hypothetical protein
VRDGLRHSNNLRATKYMLSIIYFYYFVSMIKQLYLITLPVVILFCSCSKSGDEENKSTSDIFTPTLTVQPGTAITVYYNTAASFNWTTNAPSVTVNGVGYSGSFTSPPLLVNTTYTLIAYGSNGQTNKVEVNVTVIPLPSDIYVAGFDGANVAYWKNGTAVPLAPVTGPAGAATGIAVSGADVYVCGYLNGAVYWKNSTRINLTSSPTPGNAFAIAVSGSDVYVAGDDGAGGPGGPNAAVYWKNGVRTLLQSSGVSASAKAIVVLGTDVHVAGYIGDTAVYWKNGVRTTLSTNLAKANGIAISGTDVYVVGVENGYGLFWKNGIRQVLVGVQASVANAIAVTVTSGSHVYAAGSDYTNRAQYWYDNTFTSLAVSPSEISRATSMFIFGPDLYLAGYVTTSNAAVYWRNGVRTTLATSTTASAAFANSIVVVQK